MENKDLICIVCPMGCIMEVKIESEQEIYVTGNTCPRGEIYAKKEVISPTRVVTTSVKAEGRKKGQIPCKTKGDIPKDKIFDVVKELKDIRVKPPVLIGDIIVKNVANTGVDIVATANIENIE